MGKRIPVEFGHLSFPTKKDGEEHFRAIMVRHLLNVPIAGHDLVDLVALLENHPRADEKIGSGIENIQVELSGYAGVGNGNGDRCFHVYRSDGTKDNFSFKKCVSGEDYSPFRKFLEASRHAVHDILHYKKAHRFEKDGIGSPAKVSCAISGELLTFKDAHLDHFNPFFADIVRNFLTHNKLDPSTVAYSDDGYGKSFLDAGLNDNFIAYHERVAVLRLIHKTRNLALSYLARQDRR